MFRLLCSVHRRRNQIGFRDFFFPTYCAYLTFCTNTEKNAEDRWVSSAEVVWPTGKKSKAATCTDFPIKVFMSLLWDLLTFILWPCVQFATQSAIELRSNVILTFRLTTCMRKSLAVNNAFHRACVQHLQGPGSKSGKGKKNACFYLSYKLVGILHWCIFNAC